jgi:uncharacterized membrane protein HdeD (DUF308 family)
VTTRGVRVPIMRKRSGGKAGRAVASDDDDAQPPPSAQLKGTWQATLLLGAVTLILGLIVAIHPTGSLNVIWFIIMGIFEIIGGFILRHALRAADRTLTNA